jgi:hypothetical protein
LPLYEVLGRALTQASKLSEPPQRALSLALNADDAALHLHNETGFL